MTCPQDPGVVAPLTACTTRVAADWLFGIGSGTNRRFAAAVMETGGRGTAQSGLVRS